MVRKIYEGLRSKYSVIITVRKIYGGLQLNSFGFFNLTIKSKNNKNYRLKRKTTTTTLVHILVNILIAI